MNLRAWLVDTVTVASVSVRSSYGSPSFGAQRAVKCRVEASARKVKGATGNETQADYVIRCTDAILLTDRIWLPGSSTADANLAKVPLSVATLHDKRGRFTYYEVLV